MPYQLACLNLFVVILYKHGHDIIELSDIGVKYDNKQFEWYRDFNRAEP